MSSTADRARDAQLHKLKKSLSNKLPAHILDRADVLAVLEESIDSANAVTDAARAIPTKGLSRETAQALSDAALRYIAAQDAIPALGTKLMAEVLERARGEKQ